jgi:hypothetical protein
MTPGGRPEADQFTLLLNPFIKLMVMVAELPAPRSRVTPAAAHSR